MLNIFWLNETFFLPLGHRGTRHLATWSRQTESNIVSATSLLHVNICTTGVNSHPTIAVVIEKFNCFILFSLHLSAAANRSCVWGVKKKKRKKNWRQQVCVVSFRIKPLKEKKWKWARRHDNEISNSHSGGIIGCHFVARDWKSHEKKKRCPSFGILNLTPANNYFPHWAPIWHDYKKSESCGAAKMGGK